MLSLVDSSSAPGRIRTCALWIRSSAGRCPRGRIWPDRANYVQRVRLSSLELGTNFGTKFPARLAGLPLPLLVHPPIPNGENQVGRGIVVYLRQAFRGFAPELQKVLPFLFHRNDTHGESLGRRIRV